MEIVRRKGPTSPQGLPQHGLRVPGANDTAKVDDGQVAFHEGSWSGLGKLTQQSAGSPWANADVGHLLSMLAAGLMMGTPRINTFSGDATPGKTEASFEQWCHEVQCIKDHYPEAVVQESINRLLKGAMADMAGYVDPLLVLTISCRDCQ